jgi:hypothetical protein
VSLVNRPRLLALLTLTALTMAAAVITGLLTPTTYGDLSGTGFSKSILALEFVRSPEAFARIVGASAEAFRSATRADLLFIATYGALWAALIALAPGTDAKGIRSRGLAAVAIGVLADVLENAGILAGLAAAPAPTAQIVNAATVKWLALGLAWLTLVERVLFTDWGSSSLIRVCVKAVAVGYGLAGAVALAGTVLVLWRESGVVLEMVQWPLVLALLAQALLLTAAVKRAT